MSSTLDHAGFALSAANLADFGFFGGVALVGGFLGNLPLVGMGQLLQGFGLQNSLAALAGGGRSAFLVAGRLNDRQFFLMIQLGILVFPLLNDFLAAGALDAANAVLGAGSLGQNFRIALLVPQSRDVPGFRMGAALANASLETLFGAGSGSGGSPDQVMTQLGANLLLNLLLAHVAHLVYNLGLIAGSFAYNDLSSAFNIVIASSLQNLAGTSLFLAAHFAPFAGVAIFAAGRLLIFCRIRNIVMIAGSGDGFLLQNRIAIGAALLHYITIFAAGGGHVVLLQLGVGINGLMLAGSRDGAGFLVVAHAAFALLLAVLAAGSCLASNVFPLAPLMTGGGDDSLDIMLIALVAGINSLAILGAGGRLAGLSIQHHMVLAAGGALVRSRQTGDRNRDQQSRNHEYAKKFLHVRCSSQLNLLGDLYNDRCRSL